MDTTLFLRQLRRKPLPPAVQEEYPFTIPALRGLEELTFTAPVTFLAGENGMGKSTLLEAIALVLGFNPEGGSRNASFSTADTHSPLSRWLTPVRGPRRPRDGYFLRAESFYNFATYLEEVERSDLVPSRAFASYGGKSLHRQSHGESFLALLQNRLGGRGIYLFDEPEAALSPSRQLSVLSLLHQLVGKDSQFIIATHSPILLAFPQAQILLLDEEGIRPVAYEETEHYQITRAFLQNPQRMLRELLAQ